MRACSLFYLIKRRKGKKYETGRKNLYDFGCGEKSTGGGTRPQILGGVIEGTGEAERNGTPLLHGRRHQQIPEGKGIEGTGAPAQGDTSYAEKW